MVQILDFWSIPEFLQNTISNKNDRIFDRLFDITNSKKFHNTACRNVTGLDLFNSSMSQCHTRMTKVKVIKGLIN